MLKLTTTRLLAATLLLTAGLTAACGKKQPPMPQQGPPEVSVVTIQPQRVALTTELSGRTAPYLIAEVRPQVGGIVKKRLFTEGSDVKAGQVLYQIDPASFEAALASAKANQARAEATLTTVRLKAERYQELVKIKAVSQQDNDDAQAGLKQAEAELAAARAAVQTASINLAYTKVTAPISGRIGRSAVTDGALVTASQPTALATIQQLSPMYVDVTQSSAELLKLKQNLANGLFKKGTANQAQVQLLLEDGSPYPQTGTLKFSEVTVDQSTGSITLRALFPNPQQLLLPGMFVRAVVQEGVNEQAILAPQRGVTRTPQGAAVAMVVGAEEKVEPRPIKVVRTVGDSWLVAEGLKPGDRVIVEGIQRARPGTPVKAVPFGAAPAAAGQQPAKPQQPAASPAQQPAAAQQTAPATK
jgi:membrane fusion protein (multidrug efflux system)